MKPVSVLLVGCGNIAGGFDSDRAPGLLPVTHAGAYAAHGGYRLAACIEPNSDTRLAFMQRWEIPMGFSSFDELALSATTYRLMFDVISVCSPTVSHHNDAMRALSLKPKLLFCEKPVCSTVAQTEELVAQCKAANVQLAVNHNRRWDPRVMQLKSELASGQWGKVRSASGVYNKGVLNNGSHMLDLMQDLLGPLRLVNVGTPVYDYTDDDPSVPATLVSEFGVTVTLSCGHAADYSLFELQLVTERGTVAMEDGGLSWRHRTAGPSLQFKGYQALLRSAVAEGRYLETMTTAVANIYAVLAGVQQLGSTGETALQAQRLCDAIKLSASQDARVACLHTSLK